MQIGENSVWVRIADGVGGIGVVDGAKFQPTAAKVSHAEYARTLRMLLPNDALRPNARAYIPITIHLAIIVLGWIALRYATPTWWPLITLAVGNSMACLSFLAHDVAHQSVTTNRYLLYPTELVLWSLMFIPATLWRRVHGAHHAHTNAPEDTDRRFLTSELSRTGTIAAATMFPNKLLRFNFVCMLYWVLYPIRHGIVAFFYPGRSKPHFVTGKPRYSTRDKIWIALEMALNVALQLGIAALVGGHHKLIMASWVPICIASAVAAWYFFTNHGLKPIDDGNDILAATTTVTVPDFCNKLHSNFAYHAEHHLFPNMNPAHYPLVSKLLRAHFPEQYHCIPISQAWSALLQSPIAAPSRGQISDGTPHTA